MKTYKEIKEIVEIEGELAINKPDSLTNDEWVYFNEIEKLENALHAAKANVFDSEKRIETFKALHGEFDRDENGNII